MPVDESAWIIDTGFPVRIYKADVALLSFTYSYCNNDRESCLLAFDYEVTDNGYKVNKNVSCRDLSQDDLSIENIIEDFNSRLTEYGYQIDEIVLENGETEGDLAGEFKRDFAWEKVIGFVEI